MATAPKYEPTVTLGNIGTWAGLALMALGFLFTNDGASKKEISDNKAAIAVIAKRQDNADLAIGQIREDVRANSVETRQGIARLLEQMSELKVLVASQGRPDVKR